MSENIGLCFMVAAVVAMGIIFGFRVSSSKHGLSYPACLAALFFYAGGVMFEPEALTANISPAAYAFDSLVLGVVVLLLVMLFSGSIFEKYGNLLYARYPKLFDR